MDTILHVIDTTGPGGAETVFLTLAAKTAEHGMRSIALIRGTGWLHSQLLALEIETHIIDCKGSFNIRYLQQLMQLVKSEKVTAIQSHLLGSNVYCSIAGKLTNTKVISTFHGLVDISPNERFRYLKLLALKLGSSAIISVSDKLQNFIIEIGVLKSENIQTIYNGIDISAYRKIDGAAFRERHNLAPDTFIIGSLGNIRSAKNYPLAIKTIEIIKELDIDVHYFIAGEGNDKKIHSLQSLIDLASLTEQVTLLGFTDNTQEFLSSLDLFLMTSSSEGHPLAITQAMINGLPIVTTPSGVEEIVSHQHEALIAKQHSEKDLANLIEEIYNNPELAKKLALNAGKLAVKKYSQENMINSYFSLYSKTEI